VGDVVVDRGWTFRIENAGTRVQTKFDEATLIFDSGLLGGMVGPLLKKRMFDS
jgi:hypothetical protein